MKSNKFFPAAIFSIIFLAGCAARPVTSGDSSLETKNLNYPEHGVQTHVAKGNIAIIHANYQSRFAYKIKRNLSTNLMLGKVSISTEDAIVSATLKDQPVFCTVNKSFYDIILGPLTVVCFEEGEKGTFTKMMAAPGEVWFTKKLNDPIPFSSYEIPVFDGVTSLKTEYFFEGYAKSKIFFTAKEYLNNIETPNKSKPLIIDFQEAPGKIPLEHMIINVIDVNDESLTFFTEKLNNENSLIK